MHEIKLQNNIIFVSPLVNIQGLYEELSYVHKQMVRNKLEFDRRQLYQIRDGVLVTSGGFFKRIKDWFKAQKMPYTIKNLRKLNKPPADYGRLGELREGQDEILACIDAYTGGVIVAPPAFGKSLLIVEICKMYPTLRIAVVSASISVTGTLYDRLVAEVMSSQVGRVGGGSNDIKRITVCTSRSLKKLDPQKVDMLLFDECHLSAAEDTAYALGFFTNACMFGFSASPEGRSDGADKVIEAIFGPVRFTRTYQESVESKNVVNLDVHMYAVNGNMSFNNPQERKKKGIWTNRRRNDLIASVVGRPEYVDSQILILVETVEHLLHLSNLLPDFELAYAGVDAGRLDKFVRQELIPEDFKVIKNEELEVLRKKFEKREVMRVIATGVWNTGVDFPSLNVCVRAGGGSSDITSIQSPGRLSRLSEGKTIGTLIDFFDNYEKTARDNSKKRIEKYASSGWKIIKHYQ